MKYNGFKNLTFENLNWETYACWSSVVGGPCALGLELSPMNGAGEGLLVAPRIWFDTADVVAGLPWALMKLVLLKPDGVVDVNGLPIVWMGN